MSPFQTVGQISDPQYYFVRTSDLEAIAQAAFQYTRFVDRIFYEGGGFCSSDRSRPIFSTPDFVSLECSGVFLLSAALLRKKPVPSKNSSRGMKSTDDFTPRLLSSLISVSAGTAPPATPPEPARPSGSLQRSALALRSVLLSGRSVVPAGKRQRSKRWL